ELTARAGSVVPSAVKSPEETSSHSATVSTADSAMDAWSKDSTSARAAMDAQSESSADSGTNTPDRSMASRSSSWPPAHQASMRPWVAGPSGSRSYGASTSSHPPVSMSYSLEPHISKAIRSAQASSLSMVVAASPVSTSRRSRSGSGSHMNGYRSASARTPGAPRSGAPSR